MKKAYLIHEPGTLLCCPSAFEWSSRLPGKVSKRGPARTKNKLDINSVRTAVRKKYNVNWTLTP